MIVGHINALDEMDLYPEIIQKALAYLRDTDFTNMEVGKVELDGQRLFAMIQEMESDDIENRKAESHEKYVDIQYLISGGERIGYAVLDETAIVKADMRPDKDVIFYEAPQPETFVELKPGSFGIFFPRDIHRPGCFLEQKETIRKVVVKISVDALR